MSAPRAHAQRCMPEAPRSARHTRAPRPKLPIPPPRALIDSSGAWARRPGGWPGLQPHARGARNPGKF
eukprot:14953970-Alexandrium_andersonii.AAC.1